MRNKLLVLGGIFAIALPAAAQNPHADYIAFLYTGEVLPGQEARFKELVSKIVTTVENESGTIAYKWSMRPDGKTFDVVEIYQDSQAVQAHIKDVVGKYGEEIGKNWKPVKFVVYGNPDADTKKALEPYIPTMKHHLQALFASIRTPGQALEFLLFVLPKSLLHPVRGVGPEVSGARLAAVLR
jgi:quinol monooxygenase YgiN